MSIRFKFLITLGLIVVLLSSIFFAVISPIVQDKFDAHEKMSATRKIKQVQGIFNYQFETLNTLTVDLTQWPETKELFAGENETGTPTGFIRNTFLNNARIDVLLALNKQKDPIRKIFYNRESNSVENIDPGLLQKIVTHKRISIGTNNGQETCNTCIIPFKDRYLAITTRNVKQHGTTEKVLGTILLGKFINDQAIKHLQEMTQYSVDFLPLNDGPPDVIEASNVIQSSPHSYLITFESEDTIKAYAMLKDISDQGVLMMVLSINRHLFKEHHNNLPFLLKAIIICSLTFGIILYIFFEFSISRRFTTLISEIDTIEKKGIGGSRLSENGESDEFGRLAISINNMLATNERLEQYRLKSRQLESVAAFAAGASHELSTPLSTLAVASGEMLRNLVADRLTSEDLYDDLFLIREQVDRCKFIVNQIATNTGSHLGEAKTSFTLEKLLSETFIQFRQSEIDLIKLENKLGNVTFFMPFHSICRVLRGLLRNGLESSEHRKPVVLTCMETTTHILLSVEDHGKGMDEKTIKQATDPFFSTKNPGKNLGLGLFLAQSLAERYNGELVIRSAPDQGTTVSISFEKEKAYGD